MANCKNNAKKQMKNQMANWKNTTHTMHKKLFSRNRISRNKK
jgi:hypothetical protein